MIQTKHSEITILIPVSHLKGKSKISPPSGMGVAKTKKDHVNIITRKPSFKPKCHAEKKKYEINIIKIIKNLFPKIFLVSKENCLVTFLNFNIMKFILKTLIKVLLKNNLNY